MRQIRTDVPIPSNEADDGEGSEVDPVGLLLARERARHHSELAQTRQQIAEILTSPAESLIAALDDDLAAVAIATVEAMTALRRNRTSEAPGGSGVDTVTTAIGEYLTQVAHLTRSTLAIHLTLEAQARSATC